MPDKNKTDLIEALEEVNVFRFFKQFFCRHSYAIIGKHIALSDFILVRECAGCKKITKTLYFDDPCPDVEFGPALKAEQS